MISKQVSFLTVTNSMIIGENGKFGITCVKIASRVNPGLY